MRKRIAAAILSIYYLLLLAGFALYSRGQRTLKSDLMWPDWNDRYFLLPNILIQFRHEFSDLPAKPTEQDFIPIAIHSLEGVSDYESYYSLEGVSDCEGYYPSLVMWRILCGTTIYEPLEVYVVASQCTSHESCRECFNGAVTFRPPQNLSEVRVWEVSYKSVKTPMMQGLEPEKLKWHVDDLLLLAEEQGGQNYRQAIENQCEITLLKDTNRPWMIEYSPIEGRQFFCMTVDDKTGVYTSFTDTGRCKW